MQRYQFSLVNILHSFLPLNVMVKNSLVGSINDGHQAEATVQALIAEVLAPHMPSPDLIKHNKQVLEHPDLGGCIHDVIIDRVGGSPWGYFELKTLLAKDQLTEKAVERDLRKLCAYKEAYPDAAAVFLLVGTRKRLSESYAKAIWEKAGICSEESAFSTLQLHPQILFDGRYIAIPCGWSGNANDVMTLTWEIQPAGKLLIQSSTYRFLARMDDTQPSGYPLLTFLLH